MVRHAVEDKFSTADGSSWEMKYYLHFALLHLKKDFTAPAVL